MLGLFSFPFTFGGPCERIPDSANSPGVALQWFNHCGAALDIAGRAGHRPPVERLSAQKEPRRIQPPSNHQSADQRRENLVANVTADGMDTAYVDDHHQRHRRNVLQGPVEGADGAAAMRHQAFTITTLISYEDFSRGPHS